MQTVSTPDPLVSACIPSLPLDDEEGMGLLDVAKMRKIRLARGLSQEEAAKRAGIRGGKARWANIETGRRANITMDTLARIAAALECDPTELLSPQKPTPRH